MKMEKAFELTLIKTKKSNSVESLPGRRGINGVTVKNTSLHFG